jgi:hypothetical protein
MRKQVITAATAIVLSIATTASAQWRSHGAAVAVVLAAEITALAAPVSEATGSRRSAV